MNIVLIWLVTSVSLLLISKLPTGVEIDSFEKAAIAAAIFGVLNAILGPILKFFAIPLNCITLGLFNFIINGIIFNLAAAFVEGFSLRWGFWSALIGAFLLSTINSLIYQVLGFEKAKKN